MALDGRHKEKMQVEVGLGVLPEDSAYRNRSAEHREFWDMLKAEQDRYPDRVFDIIHEFTELPGEGS